MNKTQQKSFSAAAKTLGLEIQQTPVFSRGQYLPKIGLSKDFHEAAFNLQEDDRISQVVQSVKGFCILHLDSFTPAQMEDFEKKKDSLRESLFTEKKSKVFNDFLTKLRLEANLVDNISDSEN